MYTLKAYRGPATFEQTFDNHDAYLDQREWLIANGFIIGSFEDAYAHALPKMKKIMEH